MKPDLVVVMLTNNESLHIARALDSVKGIASEIFVIDSGSKDDTARLATERGAQVLYHPFVNQAKQFQWGMDNAPLKAQWVLRLDADEIIEPDLAREIAEKLPLLSTDVTGVNLKRKHTGPWLTLAQTFTVLMSRLHGRTQPGRAGGLPFLFSL